MARWELVENADGTCDVLRGGRPAKSGVSRRAAERHIADNKAAQDKVFLREKDGYLSPADLSGSR